VAATAARFIKSSAFTGAGRLDRRIVRIFRQREIKRQLSDCARPEPGT
jgi:hypothetical protein